MIVTSFFARLGFQVDAASLIRVRRVLADLERRIRALSAPQARLGVNSQQALQRIRQVQRELNRLSGRTINLRTQTMGLNRVIGGGGGTGGGPGFVGRMWGARRASQGLGGELQLLTSTVRRLWAWWVTFNAAAGVAGSLLRTMLETESLRQRLETITGSTQGAAEAFQFIVEVARDTPGSIDDVTTAFIRLGQLGIPTSRELFEEVGNFGAAFAVNVGDMVKAASDLAVGVARPFELITGINADMRSDQSKIIFMWRGQRVEIERNTGAILEWMRTIGRNEFAGATQRWMATILGALEKLGDAWTAFQRSMADAGLRDAMAELFRELGGVLGRNDDLAVRIGQYLARAVRKLTDAVVFLEKHMETLVGWFHVITNVAISAGIARLTLALGRGFLAALRPVNLFLGAIMLIPLVLDDLASFARGGPSFLAGMWSKDEREQARGHIAGAFDHLRSAGESLLGTVNALVDGLVAMLNALFGTDTAAEAFEQLAIHIGATAAAIKAVLEQLALIPAWLIDMVTDSPEENREEAAVERARRNRRAAGVGDLEHVFGGDPGLGLEVLRELDPEDRARVLQELTPGPTSHETMRLIERDTGLSIGVTVNMPGTPDTRLGEREVARGVRTGIAVGAIDFYRAAVRAARVHPPKTR